MTYAGQKKTKGILMKRNTRVKLNKETMSNRNNFNQRFDGFIRDYHSPLTSFFGGSDEYRIEQQDLERQKQDDLNEPESQEHNSKLLRTPIHDRRCSFIKKQKKYNLVAILFALGFVLFLLGFLIVF